MNYREIANEIHDQNVKAGWWDEHLDNKRARYKTAMALCSSELSEALEGARKSLMDDHLPQYRMFEVEIADTIIRVLDLAGALEISLNSVDELKDEFVEQFAEEGYTIPEQIFEAKATLDRRQRACIRRMLAASLAIADFNGINIWKIVAEKRAYNASRADHKRENRAAAGGKAF